MSRSSGVNSSSAPTLTTCSPGAGRCVTGGSPSSRGKNPVASARSSPPTATFGAWRSTGSTGSAVAPPSAT